MCSTLLFTLFFTLFLLMHISIMVAIQTRNAIVSFAIYDMKNKYGLTAAHNVCYFATFFAQKSAHAELVLMCKE